MDFVANEVVAFFFGFAACIAWQAAFYGKSPLGVNRGDWRQALASAAVVAAIACLWRIGADEWPEATLG